MDAHGLQILVYVMNGNVAPRRDLGEPTDSLDLDDGYEVVVCNGKDPTQRPISIRTLVTIGLGSGTSRSTTPSTQ